MNLKEIAILKIFMEKVKIIAIDTSVEFIIEFGNFGFIKLF